MSSASSAVSREPLTEVLSVILRREKSLLTNPEKVRGLAATRWKICGNCFLGRIPEAGRGRFIDDVAVVVDHHPSRAVL